MARPPRFPARLVVALSVAALLSIFLLYTAIAGGSTPALKPSQLAGHGGAVALAGVVVGPVRGDSYSRGGLRFSLRDIGTRRGNTNVVYHGSVPPLFKVGRDIAVRGELRDGVFVASRDSLVTKCPSKYTASRQ